MIRENPAKPLTRRPLDLLYCLYLALHFLYTSTLGLLPLWPAEAQTLPVFGHVYTVLKGVTDEHISKSNDTFMLAIWRLLPHEWDFAHYRAFLWFELFFQLPCFIIGLIGLNRGSTTVYPLLLAYASLALVTTVTTLHATLIAPNSADASLDPALKVYAFSDEQRSAVLRPLIPFLLIPAVMWFDMMVRVTGLVRKGAQLEAQETKEKSRKNL